MKNNSIAANNNPTDDTAGGGTMSFEALIPEGLEHNVGRSRDEEYESKFGSDNMDDGEGRLSREKKKRKKRKRKGKKINK